MSLDLDVIKQVNEKRKVIRAKTTPGPWDAALQDGDTSQKWYDICSPEFGSIAHISETTRPDDNVRRLKADALFISHARTDPAPKHIDALVAEVERLRATLAEYADPKMWTWEGGAFGASLKAKVWGGHGSGFILAREALGQGAELMETQEDL